MAGVRWPDLRLSLRCATALPYYLETYVVCVSSGSPGRARRGEGGWSRPVWAGIPAHTPLVLCLSGSSLAADREPGDASPCQRNWVPVA